MKRANTSPAHRDRSGVDPGWQSDRIFFEVLSLCLGIFILIGCGRKSETSSSGTGGGAEFPLPEKPAVAECEPGVRGGRLVIATFGAPKTFNPITANESSSDDIIRLLFSGLVGIEAPTQQIKPALAESWDVEADQKTWTFRLRKGLRWSDGQPLTADDVVFTWEVIYDTNIVNVTVDSLRVDGKNFEVSKLDDHTVRIVTPEVYAPFLHNAAVKAILPRHILAKAVAEKRFEAAYGVNSRPTEVVGSGPFRLKEYKPGQHTLVERNPHFWAVDKSGQRLPYLDHVIYTEVPDFNAMALRILQGESDIHERVRPEEYQRFKEAEAKRGIRLAELGVGIEALFFCFNQNTNFNASTGKPYVAPHKLKWFRNTRFRQAISYAVDRESICRSIYSGRAKPSYGYVTESSGQWFNPGVRQYPHDPAKARALLKEIGIEDRNGDGLLEDAEGNVIEFVFNTNTGNNVREKTAVLIQDDLKKLGVKLIFQPIEFNSLIDKISSSYDFDCFLLSLGPSANDPPSDPVGSMNVLKSDGFTHHWFPRQKTPATEWEARMDFLMNAQLKTLDFAERKKYYDEVQVILSEQLPMIYTVAPQSYAAYNSRLGNVRPTVLNYYRATWNIEELYFKK
jgi:peptide/nickel transport system substrate-binding protein